MPKSMVSANNIKIIIEDLNNKVDHSKSGHVQISDPHCNLDMEDLIQWGLKNQTFEFRTHSKLEHFDVKIWDGSVVD